MSSGRRGSVFFETKYEIVIPFISWSTSSANTFLSIVYQFLWRTRFDRFPLYVAPQYWCVRKCVATECVKRMKMTCSKPINKSCNGKEMYTMS